jgi:hypothetical protein
MATAYEVKERTKAAITPRAIEDAKARAVQLLKEAYTAKPTPIDGQLTLICWNGRIARGYDKLAIARRAGDAAAIKKLQQGLAKLEAMYTAAQKAAEQAASDWAAMAAAAGAKADPATIYPPDCDCETCRVERGRKSKWQFRDAYTYAVYDFLAPNSFDLPPVVKLIRDAKSPDARDCIWAHLKRIADCAEAYAAECKDQGIVPNWRAALFPAEGEE